MKLFCKHCNKKVNTDLLTTLLWVETEDEKFNNGIAEIQLAYACELCGKFIQTANAILETDGTYTYIDFLEEK